MDFLTADHNIYSIKELESTAAKAIGVHGMQIKDLIQTLIDDDKIKIEKCGSSMVYWCFEEDELKRLDAAKQLKISKLEILQKKKAALIAELNRSKKKRASVKKSTQLMRQRDELLIEKLKLEAQVESSNFDTGTARSQLLEKFTIAESYADNIEILIMHFQRQNGVDRSYFQEEIGVPSEFKDLSSVNALIR